MMRWACATWQRALSPLAGWWLFPAALVWLGGLAWLRPLHIPDEGRYVGVAWDMVRFDSTWTPLLNGMPYFHKPPLFYWLNEFSFLIFGAHEWAARLPSVLVAWFTAVALYCFVRRHRGPALATVAFVALLTMPYYYGAAQYANLDMLVAGMISLTILAGAEAVSRHKAGQAHGSFAVAAGVFAALAVLAKGLIGVALPGGVLFFWLLATRRWSGFKVLLAPGVWIAFLVVGVPWFIAMELSHPGFLHYFFVVQHFERYLTAGFNQQQPLWFFLPVILGFCLPWTFWLLRYVWQRPVLTADASWWWLMGLWIVVITVFFSIPTSKLIGYTVPVLPALAVLIAEVVVASWRGFAGERDRRWSGYTVAAGASACLLALVGFMFANDWSAKKAVQRMLQQASPTDQYVMLDAYAFDLAFYTRMPGLTWVVFDWPALPAGDTWRNELADAGKYVPDRARDVLVNQSDFLRRLCDGGDRVYWMGGYQDQQVLWPFLQSFSPYFKMKNGVMFWKVPVDAGFRSQWCKES